MTVNIRLNDFDVTFQRPPRGLGSNSKTNPPVFRRQNDTGRRPWPFDVLVRNASPVRAANGFSAIAARIRYKRITPYVVVDSSGGNLGHLITSFDQKKKRLRSFILVLRIAILKQTYARRFLIYYFFNDDYATRNTYTHTRTSVYTRL